MIQKPPLKYRILTYPNQHPGAASGLSEIVCLIVMLLVVGICYFTDIELKLPILIGTYLVGQFFTFALYARWRTTAQRIAESTSGPIK